MSRSVALALLAVSLFLALIPLTLAKPGVPPVFKSDEPAYYLMALSLAHDRDLRLEPHDVDRLFAEFPYRPAHNLIVMTADGWNTVFYSKPYLYSLFAAPLVALFGANGMLFFNMLLLFGMVWLGASYLAGYGHDGMAALFSAGFFLLSIAFSYAYWMHPEVFGMAAVTLACYLVFGRSRESTPGFWRYAGSGAALALVAYHKPMFLVLAAGLLWGAVRRLRWRRLVAWGLGCALTLGAAAGLSQLLTGQATPYLGSGMQRQGVVVCEPGVMPIEPAPAGEEVASPSPTRGAWSWIFRVPDMPYGGLGSHLGWFLWGRHTGLLLYTPFAALALLLFLLNGRRDEHRWALLVSLAFLALVFILFIPHNWQGGGGFVGNRYFINAYPAFLFLVTRLRPRWSLPVGFAAAGLLVGPIFLTPLGAGMPEPTLQGHTRNWPLRLFPLEVALREVPGYQRRAVGSAAFLGRKDVFVPIGEHLWVHGATQSEIWMTSGEPVEQAIFLVSSEAAGNEVTIRLGDDEQLLWFEQGSGEALRVDLAPGPPHRVLRQGEAEQYWYRLTVEPSRGSVEGWTRYYPPEACSAFPRNESFEEPFFLGAQLTYLGGAELLSTDPFSVEWRSIEPPQTVVAGEEFDFPVRLVNSSPQPWRASGAARVKLSYHWLTPQGDTVQFNGKRTELRLPVEAGALTAVRAEATAPGQPGLYLLELDLLMEHVAWFADHTGGKTRRIPIEVVAADPADPPPSAP